ncbi:hypothetical protein [Singulisphaera acidiphila]|uniref:hypothetical protein n=1 Tax=Singulisphaera acidiphila TaxID=466153 RepID=UPI0012B55C8A|nr:hypothetical protein [Singulisphaera acidiphila]
MAIAWSRPPLLDAVDSDDRPLEAHLDRGPAAEVGDPDVEGVLEGLGPQNHQDDVEDVLGGDAAGQFEEFGEEFLFALGSACDGSGSSGAGEDDQDGDDQDAWQGMAAY